MDKHCPDCREGVLMRPVELHAFADPADPMMECGNCGSRVDPDEDYEDFPDDQDILYPPMDDMDGDHESALASAGFGTDEDYGCFDMGFDDF